MMPIGLCFNCMNGSIVNGQCSNCGKQQYKDINRNVNALPFGCFVHGRYYLGRVLGAGGFGITYMAWDSTANRRVALKELFPSSDVHRSSDGKTVNIVRGQENYFSHVKTRFLEEARLIASLSSYSEIINVYHLFPENNTAYYAMEYVDGENLKTYVKANGIMSWEQLKGIIADVSAQLEILHGKGLIHRDISPDNIFITDSGAARLIDFGSVRAYTEHKGLTTFLKQAYAPIEQYREHGNQGPWTDIYSLSVSMYYLLSGTLPPKAPDRVLNDAVIPIRSIAASVPDGVARVIEKGMAVYPQERYSTVKEFWSELSRCSDDTQNKSAFAVKCVKGVFSGKTWRLSSGKMLSVGRDQRCAVVYPPNTPGVSRKQCVIALDRSGRPCIMDECSSYGTFVNGLRVQNGRWVALNNGSSITFALEKYLICTV